MAWDKKQCPYEYGNEPRSSLKDEGFHNHIQTYEEIHCYVRLVTAAVLHTYHKIKQHKNLNVDPCYFSSLGPVRKARASLCPVPI